MKTLGSVLDDGRGIGRGFDFLRIFLASAIIAWHTATLTGHGDWARGGWAWGVEYALVPMFFMLSGFLVAGSGARLTLDNFIINRVFRIVPALAVDVFFGALVIGPLFTTVPLGEYFTDRNFFSYFINVFGWIHYLLPGVFKTNYSQSVNGALWTVPYEIGCYVIFAALMAFGVIKRRYSVLLVAVAMLVAAVAIQGFGLFTESNSHPRDIKGALSFLFVEKGARLLPSFVLGVVIYQFRHRIPYSRAVMFVLIGAWALISALGSYTGLFHATAFHLLALPLLAYFTVLIGLTPIPIIYPFTKGDYSYGLYLYHAPFMQALIFLFPAFFLSDQTFWLLFFAAYPLCLLVAMASWHMVEKPVLKLRKHFSFAATRREDEQQAGEAAERPVFVAKTSLRHPIGRHAQDAPCRGGSHLLTHSSEGPKGRASQAPQGSGVGAPRPASNRSGQRSFPMSFTVSSLPIEPFKPLFALDDDALAARGMLRVVADAPFAFPCRVTLDDAAPGERLILLNHEHQSADTPFRSTYAIYVREAAEGPASTTDRLPPALRRRLLSLRGFDAAGMLRDADVVEGAVAEPVIERMLADPDVAYLHAHYAKPGCYAARIDRTNA